MDSYLSGLTRLISTTTKQVPTFPYSVDRYYFARIDHNYDADTITIVFLEDSGELRKTNIRVLGVDSPELHGTTGKVHQMAVDAKKFVSTLLNTSSVYLVKLLGYDKYGGRILGDIYTVPFNILNAKIGSDPLRSETEPDKWLSEILIARGYVVRYGGAKKISKEEWDTVADKFYE